MISELFGSGFFLFIWSFLILFLPEPGSGVTLAYFLLPNPPLFSVGGLAWVMGPLICGVRHVLRAFGPGLGDLFMAFSVLILFFVLPIPSPPAREPGATWVKGAIHTGT